MNEYQQQHYLALINFLRHGLAEHTISETEPLPSAPALAEQLGFGEKPVQDALASLATVGILREDGADYRFSDDMGTATADLVCLMLLSNHFSYLNLSHLRRAFETAVLRLIMINMNDSIKCDLRSAILHMKIAETPNPKADSFFHRRLLAACGNPLVICIADAISHAMELQIAAVDQSELEVTWHGLVSIHERIYNGLCEGNLDAALQAINEHYDLLDDQLAHNRI